MRFTGDVYTYGINYANILIGNNHKRYRSLRHRNVQEILYSVGTNRSRIDRNAVRIQYHLRVRISVDDDSLSRHETDGVIGRSDDLQTLRCSRSEENQ